MNNCFRSFRAGSTGDLAYSPDNIFLYDRHDDRFEQVLAYYWVTEAQRYIQGLGFGTTYRPINMESQDVRINQWGADNSFSWDKKGRMVFYSSRSAAILHIVA